ncbi:Cuticle globin [Trichostrongylus colubriformis]|uniref:Globin-like host-protective antigen n=2 Tax=Trichostrongylus colubriformis TaxID=6319 RepID=GLBH_TRICO|nr:RecName: Full=Globin-like host-protective antigen; Flags: Precursor [Trichostrongylus colubriformis]AAA30102.1 globin-like, host-protective antigen [Trichostrongylus colubriformis]
MRFLLLAAFVAYAYAKSDEEIRKDALSALDVVPLGSTPEKLENGREFYKYFFTNHQDLRKYFKGAETFTADDIAKSDRFKKLGNQLLLSVHLAADTYDNEMIFRAFVRDTIDRHVDRGLDPKLWKEFWSIYQKFLESKGKTLSADQKAAFDAIGTRFNDEAQKQLAHHGLPHT